MSCHAILCHDTVQVTICRGCYAAYALGAIKYGLSNMGKYQSCRSMRNTMGEYTKYIIKSCTACVVHVLTNTYVSDHMHQLCCPIWNEHFVIQQKCVTSQLGINFRNCKLVCNWIMKCNLMIRLHTIYWYSTLYVFIVLCCFGVRLICY